MGREDDVLNGLVQILNFHDTPARIVREESGDVHVRVWPNEPFARVYVRGMNYYATDDHESFESLIEDAAAFMHALGDMRERGVKRGRREKPHPPCPPGPA